MGSILDAHLHLWDPVARHYDWLNGQPSLERVFGPGDIDAGRHDLVGAVFVQADCREDEALNEVRWVHDVARPLVRGIVAYAPVHHGAAAESELAALAAQPLVVGVRRLLQGLPIEAIIDPRLADGMGLLAQTNLSLRPLRLPRTAPRRRAARRTMSRYILRARSPGQAGPGGRSS